MDDRDDLTGYFEQGGALNYRHAPSDYGHKARKLQAGQGYSRESRKSDDKGGQATSRRAYSSRGTETLFEQDQPLRQDNRRLAPGERKCTQIYHYEGQTCLPKWSYHSVKHLRHGDETLGAFSERMSVAMDTSSWRVEVERESMKCVSRDVSHSNSPGYVAFQQWRKPSQED